MTKRLCISGSKIVILLVLIIIAGLLVPQNFTMPVEGATKADYNPKSFWYYPWGKSGTHKGVDIFAKKGTNVRSATSGIVMYCGQLALGGNVVLILGPKWRFHYYAHLDKISTSAFSVISGNKIIGTVGTTGNAAGKAPHLHYSIITIIPYFWRADNSIQGSKKMFYLNPIDYLNKR